MANVKGVFKKGEDFKAGVAFDALALGFAVSSALAGSWAWIMSRSLRMDGQAGWASADMWAGLVFMAMPLGFAAAMHGMWTGRWAPEPVSQPSSAPRERGRVELWLLAGRGARAAAWIGAALALALPLGALGAFGDPLPSAVATPLSYAAGAMCLALGALAFSFGMEKPGKGARWLPTAMFACGLALLACPDLLWTSTVFDCFPGARMAQAAPPR